MADLIINDSNWQSKSVQRPVVNGVRRKLSYRGMWEPNQGVGDAKGFADLGVPLIDESEWKDRIREQEKEKTNLMHLSLEMGLPCKDQASTNYCWINAPIHCAEITELKQSAKVVSFSPASAGARIKGFRNVGGWGSEGLRFMRQHGMNYSKDWPDNAINRRYDTQENRAKALLHKVDEFYVLKSWQEVVSTILARIAVALGYNWWRHEVTGTHMHIDLDLGIRNSWSMRWGNKGFGRLSGSRRYPDDAVAIVSKYVA